MSGGYDYAEFTRQTRMPVWKLPEGFFQWRKHFYQPDLLLRGMGGL